MSKRTVFVGCASGIDLVGDAACGGKIATHRDGAIGIAAARRPKCGRCADASRKQHREHKQKAISTIYKRAANHPNLRSSEGLQGRTYGGLCVRRGKTAEQAAKGQKSPAPRQDRRGGERCQSLDFGGASELLVRRSPRYDGSSRLRVCLTTRRSRCASLQKAS